MKILTLIRHAKSSWKDPSLPDWDRPLNNRGRRDAPMMGERLAGREAYADLMISSSAVRAVMTTEAIAEEIEYPADEIVVDERLYGADEFEILQVIQGLDDAWERVMLVGHNPGLTDLVNALSPTGIDNLPTCGIVELTYDTESWALIGRIDPVAVDFDYPKKGLR
jgi:phosphohistidine phosphatase